jgi:hypothetical protein
VVVAKRQIKKSDVITDGKVLQGVFADCNKAVCGKDPNRIKITVNEEAEFKIGLIASGQSRGREAEISKDLWDAFSAHREDMWRDEIGPRYIERANGLRILTPAQRETKAYRERHFMFGENNPDNGEIRIEGLKTMIKISDAAQKTPRRGAEKKTAGIIHRREVMIERQQPGLLDFTKLPDPYKDTLTHIFGSAAKLFPGYRTESTREKLLVDTYHMAPDGNRLRVTMELAYDIGAGRTLAGDMIDITEFEGEVKSIRREDGVDIKKNPAMSGLTKDDIRKMSDQILEKENRLFMDFAAGYLARNNLMDCSVVPIFESKSAPGIRALKPLLLNGGPDVGRAIENVRKNGFRTFPDLKNG